MDASVKAQWLAALRSGEYEQTRLTLRDDAGYCCLGVLCDVYAQSGQGKWTETYDFLVNGDQKFYQGVLPPPIVDWADLPSCNPMIGALALSHYNDGTPSEKHHRTFAEIADLIEGHL